MVVMSPMAMMSCSLVSVVESFWFSLRQAYCNLPSSQISARLSPFMHFHCFAGVQSLLSADGNNYAAMGCWDAPASLTFDEAITDLPILDYVSDYRVSSSQYSGFTYHNLSFAVSGKDNVLLQAVSKNGKYELASTGPYYMLAYNGVPYHPLIITIKANLGSHFQVISAFVGAPSLTGVGRPRSVHITGSISGVEISGCNSIVSVSPYSGTSIAYQPGNCTVDTLKITGDIPTPYLTLDSLVICQSCLPTLMPKLA